MVGDFSTARLRTGLCGTVQRNMDVECDSCWAVLGFGEVFQDEYCDVSQNWKVVNW